MKMRFHNLLSTPFGSGVALLFSTILACAPAQARNYIFFDQQPLTMVSDKGEFLSFELGCYDEARGRRVIDQRLARRIATLWAHDAEGEPREVSATIGKGSVGCEEGLVVKVGHAENGLLSSKRVSINTGLPVSASEPLIEQGRGLLASVLRKHKLAKELIARMVKNAKVTPVVMGRSKRASLVITAADDINERSAMVFMIAITNDRGAYVIRSKKIRTGSASDSEGYAGYAELVLRSDLDGDGIEELLVRRGAYESFSTSLLRWQGNQWQEVGINGGGC